jgi:hypothetical protein
MSNADKQGKLVIVGLGLGMVLGGAIGLVSAAVVPGLLMGTIIGGLGGFIAMKATCGKCTPEGKAP